MIKREVFQRAAKRFGVRQSDMRRYVEMYLAEVGDLLAAGEPVPLGVLGRLYPVELSEDGRRKIRGVRFLPSEYFKEVMTHRPIDEYRTVLGEIVRVGG